MKQKRIITLLLTLMLAISCIAASAEEASARQMIGDTARDFTATLSDGTTVTLSELLKTHKAVLVNFWASWCSPCKAEFPYMQEVYDEYKNDLAIVALSVEPTDTNDEINAYKEENGLTTLPMGHDDAGLENEYYVDGYPTSIMIDRNGVICWQATESLPDADTFRRLIAPFIADDYAESLVGFEIPPMLPTVSAISPDELQKAGNADAAAIVWHNSEDQYVWPFVSVTEGERTFLQASNMGIQGSDAYAYATLTAEKGDVMTFDYSLTTEYINGYLVVTANDQPVYAVSGEHDWTTYAYEFKEAGEYEIAFRFKKDYMANGCPDIVRIDNVQFLHGDAAQAAIAALPVYPAADDLQGYDSRITLLNENAKEIVFNDPTQTLLYAFGENVRYYIVPDAEANFLVEVGPATIPAAGLVFGDSLGVGFAPADMGQADNGYLLSCPVDSMESVGYSYSSLIVMPANVFGAYDCSYAVFFASEENVNAMVVNDIGCTDGSVTWQYADGTAPSTDEVAEYKAFDLLDGMAAYELYFMTEDGLPVQGVIVNVCDDSTCTPMFSDENGMVSFINTPFAYHLQVLKVPDGYEYDTTQEVYTLAESDVVVFTLTKK